LVPGLDGLECLAITPDGRFALISQEKDHAVSVFAIADSQFRAKFNDKVAGRTVCGFSPDSSKVAYWGTGRRVIVRTVPDARTVKEIEMGDVWPTQVVFTSKGDEIGIGALAQIDVIPLDGPMQTKINTMQGRPASISFSPDDRMIASCSAWGRSHIALFDRLRNGERRDLVKTSTDGGDTIQFAAADHPGVFVSVAFTPNGKRVVAASQTVGDTSIIAQWDPKTFELIRRDRFQGIRLGICFLERKADFVVGVGQHLVDSKWLPALFLIDSQTGRLVDMVHREREEFYGLGIVTDGEPWRLFTTESTSKKVLRTYSWEIALPSQP
jgi:hypothetical protein